MRKRAKGALSTLGKLTVTLLCMANASLYAATTSADKSTSASRPNVILILCDDLGYGDLGCYGNTQIRTPNIDRLSSEGVRLTQYYVTMPACSPSRASLLTGRYHLRVGIRGVLGPDAEIGLRQKEFTLAEALKNQGYATTCIGKWHLGDKKEFLPTRHGFDSFYGLPYSNDMDRSSDGGPAVPLIENEEIIEQPVRQDTLTRRYTERAVDYIRQNADRPFFLYLPHTFPHVPLHASEQFNGKSPRGLYGDVVEEIDWSTGEILKTLRELRLDKKTLVIFTSDNGPWLVKGSHGGSAGPLRDGKATVYEGGIRVPCIVRWPVVLPSGKDVTEPLISLDFFPTILKLAGGDPSGIDLDGKDSLEILKGGNRTEAAEYVFYRTTDIWAVRQGDWKLHLPRVVNKTTTSLELYNLAKDPAEQDNVAADHPDIVKRMEEYAMKQHALIHGDYKRHPNADKPLRASRKRQKAPPR